MKAINKEEYEICKRRGHEDSGNGYQEGSRYWVTCKWCNMEYYFEEQEPILRERGVDGVVEINRSIDELFSGSCSGFI